MDRPPKSNKSSTKPRFLGGYCGVSRVACDFAASSFFVPGGHNPVVFLVPTPTGPTVHGVAWFHQLRSNMVQNHQRSLMVTASPSLLPLLRHLSNSCALVWQLNIGTAHCSWNLRATFHGSGKVCAATDLHAESLHFSSAARCQKIGCTSSIPNIVAKLAANQSPEIGRVWVDQ